MSSLLTKVLGWISSKAQSKSRILRDLQAKDTVMTSGKRMGRTLWRLLHLAIKLVLKHTRTIIKTLGNPQERQRLKKRVHLGSVIFRLQHIPRSTRFLLLGIILAVCMLVIGIALLSKSQARSQAENSFQERLTTIEDLLERAAGAVIYKDEDQARSLYVNAQTLLESLPSDTPDRLNKKQSLLSDIESALDEIRHLINIPNPPLLGDLAQVNDGVFGNSLIQNQDTLYVLGSDARVYRFHRTEKRFQLALDDEKVDAVARAATQEDGRMYFLGDDGVVYTFSTEKEAIETTGVGNQVWVDIEAYANRLYVLRPTRQGQEGQVLRFERSGNTFSQESNWITSRTTSLDQAVSLAVDGTVFVLSKNGEIVRFSTGSEVDWDTGVVDPVISQATKIWTDADSQYIYVLESRTNRLIVFEKESAKFLVQYRSPAFAGLTDFVVDEKGYTIYLLAGSKLYSIAPSHLK
jgi:hypothetical protein